MRMTRSLRVIARLFAALTLVGCSGTNVKIPDPLVIPAEDDKPAITTDSLSGVEPPLLDGGSDAADADVVGMPDASGDGGGTNDAGASKNDAGTLDAAPAPPPERVLLYAISSPAITVISEESMVAANQTFYVSRVDGVGWVPLYRCGFGSMGEASLACDVNLPAKRVGYVARERPVGARCGVPISGVANVYAWHTPSCE